MPFSQRSARSLFAAVLLFHGERGGGLLAIALLPFEIPFWLGCALPIPVVNGVLRLAPLAIGRSGLR